jgi:PIN domain nuclease of toxin-antitoxin system
MIAVAKCKMSGFVAEAVLDASAVLALLRKEPGEHLVQQVIPRSLLCAVNLTEVVSKLIERGATASAALQIVRSLPYKIVDYDEDLAVSAGLLWVETRSTGLSLGDRACLALAKREQLPALTTDQRWARENIGIEVQLVRTNSPSTD